MIRKFIEISIFLTDVKNTGFKGLNYRIIYVKLFKIISMIFYKNTVLTLFENNAIIKFRY